MLMVCAAVEMCTHISQTLLERTSALESISSIRHLSVFFFPLKVAHFKDFIPQAFPGGHSMILDSEVLLIDNKTGKPLPFGSLGVHKVNNIYVYLKKEILCGQRLLFCWLKHNSMCSVITRIQEIWCFLGNLKKKKSKIPEKAAIKEKVLL